VRRAFENGAGLNVINALAVLINAAHAKEVSWRSVLDRFVRLGMRFSP
jgi:hypothetical protein